MVQAKQKPNSVIGVDAIQQICGAKGCDKGTRYLVIITSKFSKSALELAHNNDVECWDGKKLLEELYTHQFFSPPEYN